MGDLHAALLARIDELERLAKASYEAEPGAWALHHNRTRTGRADEWEIRDYDGDSLAWVGTENDARLIVRVADPATVLRGCAEDRDILRRHRPCDGENSGCTGHTVPMSCHFCDLPRYRRGYGQPGCAWQLSLARRLGVEVLS